MGGPGIQWEVDELNSVIADYFAMLRMELAREPYIKAHHRAVLMREIGRSAGSIERKHQNISAVLQELGLPWIWGYKPLLNYQEALFEVIDRHLTANRDMLEVPLTQPVLLSGDSASVFTETPAPKEKLRREQLERLVRKFDPVERDFRNRRLGSAGEQFVVELERDRLLSSDRGDLARRVRWVSAEDGDGAGFDVHSFDPDGKDRLIEVKTTNGSASTPFFLSGNEVAVAQERASNWHLYRVHLFAQRPRIFTVRPPLDSALVLTPENWRAQPRPVPALEK